MSDESLDEEDSDDGEEGEDGDEYVWCAAGVSCATCDALDEVVFTSPPEMVHPHCNCEVHRRRSSAYTTCENNWRIAHWTSEWSGAPVRNHLVIHVDVEVTCGDGTTVTDSVDVDFGDDPPGTDTRDFYSELWIEIFDHAEELLAVNCGPCTPTPVG